MKKVFSIKKFEKRAKKMGAKKRTIELAKKLWANDCDGLTAEEIWDKKGCGTTDAWMIEVED